MVTAEHNYFNSLKPRLLVSIVKIYQCNLLYEQVSLEVNVAQGASLYSYIRESMQGRIVTSDNQSINANPTTESKSV